MVSSHIPPQTTRYSMQAKRYCAAIFFCLLASFQPLMADQDRPNILWITSEDNGPELGCYGDGYADTPNIDALAKKSLRYKTCWSNAPVCAPARTTIISGMYATSLGGQHMRSGIKIPTQVKLYPQLLRESGYYTSNRSKTDYNFDGEGGGWNESGRNAHWRNRPNDETPFFSVFNLTVSHESKIRSRPHQWKHDPAGAPLPAYHPDTPEVRKDWAQYYDKVSEMDAQVGEILTELAADNLDDSTIVFYYGDHGSGMPRSKRWPFNSGLSVPLLLHIPERFLSLAPPEYEVGAESKRLTSFVDLAPTALNLAGATIPRNMQGKAFAGNQIEEPAKYIFGFRGRMDERIDMVRSCTDGRFVYMRHFYPERPYLKHVDYMFQTPTTRIWKQEFDAGNLNEAQAKFWKSKPVEELFDLRHDPDEVQNLAESEKHQVRLAEMRTAVKNWMLDTLDLGVLPEAEMHRLASKSSPRSYAINHESEMRRWIELSFKSLDGTLRLEDLNKLTRSADSVERFWAVRGLALSEFNTQDNVRLINAIRDPSPSVAIAACEGLLRTGNKAHIEMATLRLLELADVEEYGHFSAIAALNIIDMNVRLSQSHQEKLKQLPRSIKNPPPRIGKYVGKLLDHAVN